MGTKLLILAQSYIFTGWIDLGKAISDMFGGGGDSKEDLTNAANSLDNIRPYLHFQDAVGQVFNWIKWGIIKAFYNLANGAEDLATHSLDFSKLLSDAGLKDWIQGYILGAAAAVMIAVLVWIGIKMMLGKEKTPVQNIILQAIIATFLMFNLQPLTNWVVDQSSNIYKAEVTDGNTSSIPFDIIKGNTNDIAYLVYNNWPDFKTKGSGKIKTQSDEDYGHNGWDNKNGKKSFDLLSATNLASAITPDTVDSMEKTAEKLQKDHHWKSLKFKPKYLKYQLIDGGDKPAAVKISKSSVPFSNSYSGGYQRYTVAFLPVVVSLFALSLAFAFITYVVVKSFLDLAIMQVLALLIFSTDLDSGAKTKAAINDMFTAALTIALQGFELAFYRIVVNFLTNADMGPLLYCVAMIAATAMLWTGSQKTAKFFGVDTGAQKGWAMGAIVANQTAGLVKKGAGLARGTGHLARKGFDTTESALTGLDAAHKARENGKTWGQSLRNGASRHQWNKASRSGLVPTTVSEMADKMASNNGLTDNEYNSLRQASTGKPYTQFANEHAEALKKSGLRSAIDNAEQLKHLSMPDSDTKGKTIDARRELNDALRSGKHIMNDPNASGEQQKDAAQRLTIATSNLKKAANVDDINDNDANKINPANQQVEKPFDKAKPEATTQNKSTESNENISEHNDLPKVNQEIIPGGDTKKDVVTQGGTEQLKTVKEEGKAQKIDPTTQPDNGTKPTITDAMRATENGHKVIPGKDSKKDVITQGGTEQLKTIKEEGKHVQIDPNTPSSPDKISENLTHEPQNSSTQTIQGSDTKTNIKEQGGTNQVLKSSEKPINSVTTTQPSVAENTTSNYEQLVPDQKQQVHVTQEGPGQSIEISTTPSNITSTVKETSAEYIPASNISSTNPNAPTIESFLHSKKHYIKKFRQDVTTEINKDQINHTIEDVTKRNDFKSNFKETKPIAPKPRKDK
ncbi:hypothetical protein FOF71_08315 [Lactobacillus paragasseri]|uniref:DUF8208 domain-containing protein n=1 Tax=Lactobacillus paragasseri TaxID=2107999 RepID=A0AAW6XPW2_9LACO|nr:hypothetical protein [Lactobacillus paragasseri]MDK6868770.1 hypothetical protein [Lactobacillus paragasseri]TVU99318.1 hypothetical protein FOF71_08315 [Lactobacillus paragasseri]